MWVYGRGWVKDGWYFSWYFEHSNTQESAIKICPVVFV